MKKLVKIFCFIFLTFLALTFFVTIVRGKVEYFTYSVCKGEDKIYFVGRDGILYAIEGREGKNFLEITINSIMEGRIL